MTQKLFNLNRALYEVSGKDWSGTDPEMARVLKKLQTWPQLHQNKCSVVVGSANSGKTSEFRLQVQRLREANVHACFIAVRELMDSGNVDDALERPEAKELGAWDKTPTKKLYLFVDSIDEGALGGPRDLKACLRKLVNRVRGALDSVTWVLSTRPAVLNQEVIKVIEDALEVAIPLSARTAAAPSLISQAASTSTVSQPATPPAQQVAKVYRLAPLSRTQARTLLENAYSFQDVDAGAVKAMEDEFQLYLAGQLAVVGRKHYSVFRESQGADDARRDISVADAAHGWKVTLELKVTGGGWTVDEYRESLRNQLVGLYMRERNTTAGFFVVLKQTSSKGASTDFDALLELLRSDALQLQAERPELRLRIIGIDATEPLKTDGTLVRTKAAPKAVKDARKAARKTKRAASGTAAGSRLTA